MPAWIRSALTTLIAVGAVVASLAASGVVSVPAGTVALVAAVVAAARTALAALDPGQPLYGVGSGAEDDRDLPDNGAMFLDEGL